jgi:hypothetical protein
MATTPTVGLDDQTEVVILEEQLGSGCGLVTTAAADATLTEAPSAGCDSCLD